MAPDVPTMDEAGVPGFEFNVWNGMVAPAGTAKEIITRLQSKIVKALAVPQLKARLAALGIETVGSTPEEFGALLDKDIVKWRQVVKASGMTVD